MQIQNLGWWISWVNPIQILKFSISIYEGKRRSKEFHPTFKIGFDTWRANKLTISYYIFLSNKDIHLCMNILITPMWHQFLVKSQQLTIKKLLLVVWKPNPKKIECESKLHPRVCFISFFIIFIFLAQIEKVNCKGNPKYYQPGFTSFFMDLTS